MAYVQRGVNIDGTTMELRLGQSVSTSLDGLTIAIGAPQNGLLTGGLVQVYDWTGTIWMKRGSDIDPTNTSTDRAGLTVALSGDGNTVALGLTSNGVYTYRWNGTSWAALGTGSGGRISGVASDLGSFGTSVDINYDGNVVIVGAPNYDIDGMAPSAMHGRVAVYNLNNGDFNGSWIQRGSNIIGAAGQETGFAVAITPDGVQIAVGSPGTIPDGGDGIGGVVDVYFWNSISWNSSLPTIEGPPADFFYGNSRFGAAVDITDFGDIVIVGAPNANSNQGLVVVYQGTEILGQELSQGGFSGREVAISGDGLRLAFSRSGATDIYFYNQQNGEWGQDSPGNPPNQTIGGGDSFGLAFSNDGQTVVIGRPLNDPSAISNAGSVAAYFASIPASFTSFNNSYTFPTRNINSVVPLPPVPAFTGNFQFAFGGGILRVGASNTMTPNIPGVGQTISSATGMYGTFTINPTNESPTLCTFPKISDYSYSLANFPATPGSNIQDKFLIAVGTEGSSSANDVFEFYVIFNINPELFLDPIAAGTIVTSVNSVGTPDTTNLSGTLNASQGTPSYSFNIDELTTGPPTARVAVLAYGTLTLNTTNGEYFYTLTNPPNTAGPFTESTVMRVIDATGDTKSRTFNIALTVRPELILDTPTIGTVSRAVNDTIPPVTSNLTGTLSASGGDLIYSYDIVGSSPGPGLNEVQFMMMFGTLVLNTNTGTYTYTINNPPNVQGTMNDDIQVRVEDSTGDTKTATLRVTYTVLAEFQVSTPPNGSVIKQINNPNITEISLSGNIFASGGKTSYTYAVNGSNIGTYGTFTLNSTSGAYSYGSLDIPDTTLSTTDVFNIDVTDADGRIVSTTFTVNITVTSGIVLIMPPNGKIFKAVDGVNITQEGTTGTLMQVGAGPPFTYGIQGGFTIGANQVAFGQHGQLTITIATGAYNYVPDPILNVEDRFSDSFIITLLDGSGATARTTYQVDFQVNPQLLVDIPEPSRGSITRNITETGFTTVGLSGTYSPRGGLPPYAFSIQGGTDTGTFFEQTMSLGKLRVNKTTGFYEFIEPNVPNVPSISQNTFIVIVTDGNGDTQSLEYVVQITVKSITLDLLPVFTDVENRSALRYWNFIIHTGISSQITRFFENTEVLVIGQTNPNSAPERNIDAILRQLLLAAIETTEIGTGGEDVVTNIRNNTKDVLETEERSGVLTYSIRFVQQVSSNREIERIVELADILSTSHKNFLLNRYRSNIGEGLIVFYYDDAPQTVINDIITQIDILSRLGVGGVILALIATDTTKDPAKTSAIDVAYANTLGAKQSGVITQLANIRTIKQIISCCIRYDIQSNRYQNVGVRTVVESGQPRVPEQLQYTIPTTLLTRTLFDGISALPQFTLDSAFTQTDLRIVITEVNQTLDQAKGIVLYSRLNSLTTKAKFISSRPLPPTQTANRTLNANISFLEVEENQPQQVLISGIAGSTARPRDLRPGDVLYNEAYSFAQPDRIILLMSTVTGVNIQNAIGKTIYLQIDDGVRFPNNPVFPATIITIDQRFDSSTLQPQGSSTSIQFGSDYQIRVQLPTVSGQQDTFRAAPLEEYTRFPRLGFVTVYFGRETGTTTGIGPYARGAVIALA